MRQLFPYILLLINALCFSNLTAQDIFDLEHSKQYAAYLLKQKKYLQAAEEWKTIVKREPSDSNNLALLHTYRIGGLYNEAETFATKHFSANPHMQTEAFTEEFIKVLLQNNRIDNAQSYLAAEELNIDTLKRAKYNFESYLLDKDWLNARELYQENKTLSAHKDISYQTLLQRAENMKSKSPALASVLSAAVPGLGKVYTKDWKNGAITFLLVGTSALQSYWGFKDKGTRSVYGWVFGGLALGYYSGNIYGAYRSAHKYNERQEEEIVQDAKRIIFSAY